MYQVNIHVAGLPPVEGSGKTERASAPDRFAVAFSGEDGERDAKMGFAEIRILLDAKADRGTLELVRADRDPGGEKDIVVDRDAVEGDGVKLLLRRYSFSYWETDNTGLHFYGCVRK